MRAAREHGINFLDDARDDDETGSAPIPTGWSEVVFGELFRAAGWDRAETVVANKLWWEFWPDRAPPTELDGSLRADGLRLRRRDLRQSAARRADDRGAGGDDGRAGASGRARAWAVVNWQAEPCRAERRRGPSGAPALRRAAAL